MSRITDRTTIDGTYLAFTPTTSMESAMASAVPGDRQPSFMQAAHLDLRTETSETGEQDDIWLGFTYRVPGRFDAEAMARAITRWVQRHGVMRGWFVADADRPTGWTRVDLAPADIAFTPREGGPVTADEVNERVSDDFRAGCNPLGRIGYSFRAVAGEDETIFYIGLDHSYTDGFSFFLVYYELDALYTEEVGGAATELPPVGDFMDFAQVERERVADVDINHPSLPGWADFWFAGDQELGRFPLPLGTVVDEPVELEHQQQLLLTGDEAAALDAAAERLGTRTTQLVYAAVGLAGRELGQAQSLRFLNPVHTRDAPEWLLAAGWFINVMPVHIDVSDGDLVEVAGRVRQAFRTARTASELPAMKIYDVVEQALGVKLSQVGERFMLSYMDLRHLPGATTWGEADAVLVSRGGRDTNATSWIMREDTGMYVETILPGTAEALAAAPRLYGRTAEILRGVL
ncbi:condensation domain-containing protein [Janibacter anophelis]|uniref:condensation domain-containing protein n=1 Tax=Janibacter anophelis TaxID=319054 RepID=UPI00147036FE|nr:condensation domain-containing protein [Janibacter anophelis]